ncbi:hypothetical protein BGZ72_006553 [Mortierella alpina]|nr:hypothetical protein BGZ72_006553 [Mortierella alpina]
MLGIRYRVRAHYRLHFKSSLLDTSKLLLNYPYSRMETLSALKQRHFTNPFDDEDDPLPHASLFSPERLVDAAIRSPFNVYADRSSVKGTKAKLGSDRSKTRSSSFSNLKAILSAWGLFLGFLALIVSVMFRLHYTLPTAVFEGVNPVSGKLQFSEENVRRVVRYMTKDIGYRVVGTEQEQETKNYLIKELTALKEEAKIEGLRRAQELPNFDMWVQVGDGSHRFDFMSKGMSSLWITNRREGPMRLIVNLPAAFVLTPQI